MCFDELEYGDLHAIRCEVQNLILASNLPYEIKAVAITEDGSVEVTANVVSDPLLTQDDGTIGHRSILATAILFTLSPETDRPVIWVTICYSLDKKYSNYFPVPDEYEDQIAISFNWEFDRETLLPGCAEVRDRGFLHYVSVLPNEHLVEFVKICSEIVEQWA